MFVSRIVRRHLDVSQRSFPRRRESVCPLGIPAFAGMTNCFRFISLMSILFVLFSCGDDAAGRAGGAENESFSLWCGDRPCAWEVEEGVVEPVPTWHSKDQGIGFLSDPAQISQVVDLDSVSCITLSLLADLEEDAVFFWKVDFNNDGFDETLDGVVKISDNNWKTQYREMRVPDGTTTARSIFEKQGKGRVVLSTSHFMGDYYCASNPPPLSPDPDGGEE